MTDSWKERTTLLIDEKGTEKLARTSVMIVGLGGVGSFAAEFLARAGIGTLIIADGDSVDKTNINRQLPALHSTIGMRKAELVAERLRDINPALNLSVRDSFLLPEDMDGFVEAFRPDFVLDCIDSVTPKIELIKAARRRKIRVVSAMGAGGKTDPAKVTVRDISKTENCFLARQIRKRLCREGIFKGFRCVYSTEIQKESSLKMTDGTDFKKSFYGTISYMPALFGLHAAADVIDYLLNRDLRNED